ncbi:MAG: YciI family protein [Pseudomonadota bacterium]
MLLAVAAVQSVATPAPVPAQPIYVLTYEQGPKWIVGQPMEKQRLLDHGRYLHRLMREGVVIGAGPFTGEHAGMALVRARDEAAARAILAADPAIVEGIFVGRVRAWAVAIDSKRPLRD